MRSFHRWKFWPTLGVAVAAIVLSACGQSDHQNADLRDGMNLPTETDGQQTSGEVNAAVQPSPVPSVAKIPNSKLASDPFLTTLQISLASVATAQLSLAMPVECSRGLRLGLLVDERCLLFGVAAK